MFAHDLLFRYYMGCAKQMAMALVSMLGSKYKDFISADELPECFNSDITEAYRIVRKKTICSLIDMSERKIGYFDAVPDGYVEQPRKDGTHRRIRIFKPESRYAGYWVSGYAVPDGWKTRNELTPEEFDAVAEHMGWETSQTKKRRAMEMKAKFSYAYSPITLECRRFERDRIPSGWVTGMINSPEQMLKERIGTERSCLAQCKNGEQRTRIQDRLNVLLGMLERKSYDEALSDSSISGIYEMDGRRMLLKNWADEYGICLKTLRNRIQRGWDLRRALYKKPGKKPEPTIYEYDGLKLPLSAWSAKSGIPAYQIKRRMENGMSFEQSMLTPYEKVPSIPSKYECSGKMMTLRQMSEIAGIPVKLIRNRIKHGWKPEAAAKTAVRKKRKSGQIRQ